MLWRGGAPSENVDGVISGALPNRQRWRREIRFHSKSGQLDGEQVTEALFAKRTSKALLSTASRT